MAERVQKRVLNVAKSSRDRLREFHNTAIVRWNGVETASILEATRPENEETDEKHRQVDLRKSEL